MKIRSNAKALIIENGCLLVIEKRETDGTPYYGLPGGGQEPCELLPDTLRRECLEELGAHVQVGDLVFVSDAFVNGGHHVYHAFRAVLLTRPDVAQATEFDASQVGLKWLPLTELSNANIYPKLLRRSLNADGEFTGALYTDDSK